MGPTVAAVLLVLGALVGGIAFANFILPHQFTVGERQAIHTDIPSVSIPPPALTQAERLRDFREEMDQTFSARRQRPEPARVTVRAARPLAEDPISVSNSGLDQRLPDARETLRTEPAFTQRLNESPAFDDDWRRP